MKKHFSFFMLAIFLLVADNTLAQDSLFVGTWKMNNIKTQKMKAPATIKVEMVDGALVVVPDKNSNDVTRLVTYDAHSMTVEQISLNTKTNQYETKQYTFKLNESDNTISAVTTDEKGTEPMVLKYAFQTTCCSNHHPNHCATSAAQQQQMKGLGCTGLHGK